MGGGGVRSVARAYLVLGLAAAFFAMYALTLDPATFQHLQLQMIDDSGHRTDCAVTAAEAMEMRAHAVLVLIIGAAQAMMAMVAILTTSRSLVVSAQLFSLGMALTLADVLVVVVNLAIGRCHGIYQQVLVASYVSVTVSFGLLFIHGLFALFSNSKVDG